MTKLLRAAGAALLVLAVALTAGLPTVRAGDKEDALAAWKDADAARTGANTKYASMTKERNAAIGWRDDAKEAYIANEPVMTKTAKLGYASCFKEGSDAESLGDGKRVEGDGLFAEAEALMVEGDDYWADGSYFEAGAKYAAARPKFDSAADRYATARTHYEAAYAWYKGAWEWCQ